MHEGEGAARVDHVMAAIAVNVVRHVAAINDVGVGGALDLVEAGSWGLIFISICCAGLMPVSMEPL